MEPPRALLIDIDGVLVVSWKAIDGARDALARIRAASVPFRLVTNTTSRSRSRVAAAVFEAGIPVTADELLTAPAATAAYLRHSYPGARCLLLSSGEIRDELDGIDVVLLGDIPAREPVDVVVLGGAGPEFTYEAVSEVFDRVVSGTPLVAMHRNLSWKTDRGLQLDTGGYVHAIEEAAGIDAVVMGKPDPAFFATALADLGVESGEATMIGDDIDADVLGAQACGIHGVLVKTGKYRVEQVARAHGRPDVIVDSFADVPALLGLGDAD